MDNNQKANLRAILLRQRESHQKLFDLQGQMIDALREALAAVSRTQDEMAKVFTSDNAVQDLIDEDGSSQ